MIARVLIGVFVVLTGIFVALWTTFLPAKLDVPEGNGFKSVAVNPVEGVSIYGIKTGEITFSEATTFRGGSFSKQRNFNVGVIYIRHPRGDLMIDAGMGRSTAEHIKMLPWIFRKTHRIAPGKPAAEQLRDAGVDLQSVSGVLITHAHWDHVSGLEHFSHVPVFMPKEELDFIKSGNNMALLAKQLIGSNYKLYEFKDGAYLGFEKSFDFYGDGSVVIVPAYAHTPGSVIVFVTVSDGKRYAFIGDLAWQKEGVDLPAEKPWPIRKQADFNDGVARKLLGHMHRLQKKVPGLIVVPAHDARVWAILPGLAAR
ncbi:MAG: MBL fold metallo-hydrolase [Methyloligellaceae bacterium]